jgi:hypothetical protein
LIGEQRVEIEKLTREFTLLTDAATMALPFIADGPGKKNLEAILGRNG